MSSGQSLNCASVSLSVTRGHSPFLVELPSGSARPAQIKHSLTSAGGRSGAGAHGSVGSTGRTGVQGLALYSAEGQEATVYMLLIGVQVGFICPVTGRHKPANEMGSELGVRMRNLQTLCNSMDVGKCRKLAPNPGVSLSQGPNTCTLVRAGGFVTSKQERATCDCWHHC